MKNKLVAAILILASGVMFNYAFAGLTILPLNLTVIGAGFTAAGPITNSGSNFKECSANGSQVNCKYASLDPSLNNTSFAFETDYLGNDIGQVTLTTQSPNMTLTYAPNALGTSDNCSVTAYNGGQAGGSTVTFSNSGSYNGSINVNCQTPIIPINPATQNYTYQVNIENAPFGENETLSFGKADGFSSPPSWATGFVFNGNSQPYTMSFNATNDDYQNASGDFGFAITSNSGSNVIPDFNIDINKQSGQTIPTIQSSKNLNFHIGTFVYSCSIAKTAATLSNNTYVFDVTPTCTTVSNTVNYNFNLAINSLVNYATNAAVGYNTPSWASGAKIQGSATDVSHYQVSLNMNLQPTTGTVTPLTLKIPVGYNYGGVNQQGTAYLPIPVTPNTDGTLHVDAGSNVPLSNNNAPGPVSTCSWNSVDLSANNTSTNIGITCSNSQDNHGFKPTTFDIYQNSHDFGGATFKVTSITYALTGATNNTVITRDSDGTLKLGQLLFNRNIAQNKDITVNLEYSRGLPILRASFSLHYDPTTETYQIKNVQAPGMSFHIELYKGTPCSLFSSICKLQIK